jgi:hypothetical protein
MNYAVHLPKGWADIAQQLQERLEPFVAAGGVVLQVKEKFGGLRVYTQGHDVPDLDDLCEAAEKTCVECGSPGTMSARHGWVSPRCEEHK